MTFLDQPFGFKGGEGSLTRTQCRTNQEHVAVVLAKGGRGLGGIWESVQGLGEERQRPVGRAE